MKASNTKNKFEVVIDKLSEEADAKETTLERLEEIRRWADLALQAVFGMLQDRNIEIDAGDFSDISSDITKLEKIIAQRMAEKLSKNWQHAWLKRFNEYREISVNTAAFVVKKLPEEKVPAEAYRRLAEEGSINDCLRLLSQNREKAIVIPRLISVINHLKTNEIKQLYEHEESQEGIVLALSENMEAYELQFLVKLASNAKDPTIAQQFYDVLLKRKDLTASTYVSFLKDPVLSEEQAELCYAGLCTVQHTPRDIAHAVLTLRHQGIRERLIETFLAEVDAESVEEEKNPRDFDEAPLGARNLLLTLLESPEYRGRSLDILSQVTLHPFQAMQVAEAYDADDSRRIQRELRLLEALPRHLEGMTILMRMFDTSSDQVAVEALKVAYVRLEMDQCELNADLMKAILKRLPEEGRNIERLEARVGERIKRESEEQ